MKSIKAFALPMLLFVLAGCAQTPPDSEGENRQQLKIDPDVLYSMKVTELIETRKEQPDGGSLLHVQFAIEALADASMAWRVTWFDANGMVVQGVAEGYRQASLLMGQTRYFSATATHNRAVDYQLHLREPE
jgi:uncharacterized protein YcfL